MALITVERVIPASVTNKHNIELQEENHEKETTPSRANILSEIYIAVRGADIIFPYNEFHRFSKSCHKTILKHTQTVPDIQQHLQAIFKLLRPQDKIQMAVKLESQVNSSRTRYLLVVSNGTDQSCLLGIDCEHEHATIGLVLAIWNDMQITLDGDGGFRITSGTRHHIFKPVSVQAMWSAFQALHLASQNSIQSNYFEGGSSHQWVSFYRNNINSEQLYLHEWHTITDASESSNKLYEFTNKPVEQLKFEELITAKLKKIMMSVDLEQVTSKEIRNELEAHFKRDLTEFKSYIDKEMIRIMGQMDEASKILDYLYLGSEWNASNFEELKGKGVKKILNVTCEIDNFFPGSFEYFNIRVHDEESTDMLRHLNDTYYYIRKAKDEGSKVLVHCKKGISRSASVVVAYIMKEKSCDLYEALEYVRKLRSNIRPNPEFLKQLEIYQGMLNASNNKNNVVWRSNSESDLKDMLSKKSTNTSCDLHFAAPNRERSNKQGRERYRQRERPSSGNSIHLFPLHQRRRSWPPKEASQSFLFAHQKENVFPSGANPFCTDYILDSQLAHSHLNSQAQTRPRVKERIEDFENIKSFVKSNNLLKKNITKNGLVSNLACQFESKDKEKEDKLIMSCDETSSPSL